MGPIHWLRMAKWARHPPSAARVKLVVGVIVACLILVGIERYIGWPDALTLDDRPHIRLRP